MLAYDYERDTRKLPIFGSRVKCLNLKLRAEMTKTGDRRLIASDLVNIGWKCNDI